MLVLGCLSYFIQSCILERERSHSHCLGLPITMTAIMAWQNACLSHDSRSVKVTVDTSYLRWHHVFCECFRVSYLLLIHY